MSNKWQSLINYCKQKNMDYRRMKSIVYNYAEKYYLKGQYDSIDQAIDNIIELIITKKNIGR